MADRLVEQVERDAARQAQAARESYASRMRLLRKDFTKQQRDISNQEKGEMRRIERWRVTAIAAIEGRPVPLDDIRSMRLEEDDRKAGAVRQGRYRARGALREVAS